MNKNDWKTKTATAATILMGISGIILHFTDPTNPNAMNVKLGAGLILAGFAGFGFADKLQKIFTALNK